MATCTDVQRAIAQHGILLVQDKTAMDVVGILAGEKLSTSWWGHAAGRKIFACLERLDVDPNVLATRLVAGKITYIHRRLWPAFLAIARSRASWQMNGLSTDAAQLLDSLKKSGVRATGRAAKELQERLLVHAEQVHTESGRHATRDVVARAEGARRRCREGHRRGSYGDRSGGGRDRRKRYGPAVASLQPDKKPQVTSA